MLISENSCKQLAIEYYQDHIYELLYYEQTKLNGLVLKFVFVTAHIMVIIIIFVIIIIIIIIIITIVIRNHRILLNLVEC